MVAPEEARRRVVDGRDQPDAHRGGDQQRNREHHDQPRALDENAGQADAKEAVEAAHLSGVDLYLERLAPPRASRAVAVEELSAFRAGRDRLGHAVQAPSNFLLRGVQRARHGPP